MTKFERVLTDAEIHDLIRGNPFTLGLSVARLKDFMRQVEKAVVAKLVAEQEPMATVAVDVENGVDVLLHQIQGLYNGMRLYAHPMPCVSPTIDKTVCVPESAESDNEDAELLKKALENLIGAAHPSYMTCRLRQENLIRARDIAFKALETHRLNAKEQHKTAKNHIPDAGEMVIPDGWQLVPKKPTGSMLALAQYKRKQDQADRISPVYMAMLDAAPRYTGDSNE